jgi:rhodanese-related sulfurtransferase
MLKRFDIRGSFCDSDFLCGWITIGDSFCPKIKGIFSLLIKGREIDYLDLKEKVNCLKYCSKIILTQLYAILLSFVFPATITFSSPSPFTANDLRHDQLVQKDSVTIIDVRPPEAFSKGHIQGAVNIPAKDVAVSNLPRTSPIVVYCSDDSCPSDSAAAKNLIDAGYTDVRRLEGGFSDWLKHGYPASSSRPTQARPKHTRTPSSEARKRLLDKSAVPLDVRSSLEFKAGHLPGAINAPLENLETHFIDLPQGKEIIVYDRQDKRAKQALDKLRAAGFKASRLSGGIAAWVKKGNPLEVSK